ncbi:hypothetical protein [Bacillus sp. FJAT-27445]|uniref:hypothetical protein n=1 Tax=Bacillus sp. FJAT-27445 TaxID=1679166 RepID=UPI000743E01D|nr:hypothetical protein [Bacillus sp. FJAT-27445]
MKVIWTLFKQNKLLNIFNICASTILFFLLFILTVNINSSSIETSTTKKFKDKNIYIIADQLFEEKEKDFFSELNNYDILNNFVNNLNKSQDFEYYNSILQPIGVSEFKGDSIFEAYYEMGHNQPPYKWNKKSYRNIKSMQLNKTVFDLNNIQLEAGRYFTNEEYIFNKNTNRIPIILGSEFSSIYHLGDTIDMDYYSKEFKGTVIGFLSPFQKIVTANQPEVLLDRYIIIPAIYFNEPPSNMIKNNSIDPFFIKLLLLTRSNGTIITELSPLEIRNLLDGVALTTGFSDFEIIGANNLAIVSLVKMTEMNRNILYIVTFFLFIITLTMFIFTLSSKFKKNVETYLVMLISGANLKHIKKFARYEFIIINLIGSSIPAIILLWLFHNTSLLVNYLLIVAISIFIMLLLTNKLVKKTIDDIELVQKLKG